MRCPMKCKSYCLQLMSVNTVFMRTRNPRCDPKYYASCYSG